ncbi:MAG: ATP-binding protein [Bdellovibrionia bacterium]
MAIETSTSSRAAPTVKLKTLVFVFSGVLAVIPVVLFGLTQSIHWKTSHTRLYEQRAIHRAEFIAEEASQMVLRQKKALEALARSISDLGPAGSPKLPLLLSSFKEMFFLRSLYLVDLDGYEIVSDKSANRHYFGDRDYIKLLLRTQGTVFSDAIFGRVSGKPTVQIAVPIFDRKGKLQMILSSGLSLSDMEEVVSRPFTNSGIEFEYLILDKQQRVLVSFGLFPRAPLSRLGSQHPLQLMPRGSSDVFHGKDENGRELHGLVRSMSQDNLGWTVAVLWPNSVIVEDAWAAAREMLWFSGVALTISLILSYFIARVLIGPLAELVRALLSLGEDNLDQPIRLSRRLITVEMVELKNAFERMRGRLYDHTLHLEKTITDRTRELEAQRAKSEYAGKMAALGEMAGGVAHEINNPLAIICGSTEFIQSMIARKDVDQAKLGQLVDRIHHTAFRIVKIVKALRFFARDGSNAPFERESFQAIINDTLEFCQEKFRSHSVNLQLAPISPELKIDCQAVQISQVLLNLLQNAFDAVQGLETRWIRLEVFEAESEIRIVVTDSGTGIPAELRSKIMLPFFTTKDVGKGTGLGLSISQGIITHHRGSLSVDDTSENTCFVVRLPRIQPSNQASRSTWAA